MAEQASSRAVHLRFPRAHTAVPVDAGPLNEEHAWVS